MTNYLLTASNYLPKFLKDSDLMLEIMNCLDVLISEKMDTFKEIEEAYFDTIYKNRDYSMLSYEAKYDIIKELGFDYILDIFSLTSNQLTQLLIFFHVIYTFKGKREGLDICLQFLNIVYTYVTWDELSPTGQEFTATLTLTGAEFSQQAIYKKLKNFVRSYLLPWVNIVIEEEIEAPTFYVYPSIGILMWYKNGTIFSCSRDVLNIAIYDDQVGYDKSYYGAEINYQYNGIVTNPDKPSYKLTIVPTPSNATVIIDGVKTTAASIPQGDLIEYQVYQDTSVYRTKVGQISLTCDKTLYVNLKKL